MILVTGGTGLVGSHLLYELCRSGQRVRATKRPQSDLSNVKRTFGYYSQNVEALFQQIEWVDADLLDIFSLLDAMEDVTQVYHCAAVVSFDKKQSGEMEKTNVEGTANMVNAALEKGVQKFCHVSSIASLGREENGGITTETTLWKSSPENSNYSISKYAAEREVWRASEEGLDVVIVNPSLIIGPGDWQKSSSAMFGKAAKGIKFYTSGENGYVDVRDVAALMIRLMNSNIINQRYILNAENATLRHFFDLVHTAFGKPLPSIKAGPFLTQVAWRAEKVKSMLTGAAPALTKETAQSANKVSKFSNKKILDAFPDFKFIPLEQSVKDTCRIYLEGKKIK